MSIRKNCYFRLASKAGCHPGEDLRVRAKAGDKAAQMERRAYHCAMCMCEFCSAGPAKCGKKGCFYAQPVSTAF